MGIAVQSLYLAHKANLREIIEPGTCPISGDFHGNPMDRPWRIHDAAPPHAQRVRGSDPLAAGPQGCSGWAPPIARPVAKRKAGLRLFPLDV